MSSNTERAEGQVCPNQDCHIDQRFPGFRGLACPECATRLVVACSECDSGAVEEVDGSPLLLLVILVVSPYLLLRKFLGLDTCSKLGCNEAAPGSRREYCTEHGRGL